MIDVTSEEGYTKHQFPLKTLSLLNCASCLSYLSKKDLKSTFLLISFLRLSLPLSPYDRARRTTYIKTSPNSLDSDLA